MCALAEMMGCPPSTIRGWNFSDVNLMLLWMKHKSKPQQVEIQDVEQMAGIFGAEVNGRRTSPN